MHSLEAHKCGVGVLTREALVPIGSGPNNEVNDVKYSLLLMNTVSMQCVSVTLSLGELVTKKN